MTLQTFNKSIQSAKKICEDAATVVELTKEMKPQPTTFIFPAAGLNYGQLVTELKNLVSPMIQVSQEGDKIKVVTTNEATLTKALKGLGISVSVDGNVNNDMHTN